MSDSKRGAGGSGHPEPGSGHDDSKTETVRQGPDVAPIDGVPGAHGEVETVGGAVGEAESGKATEVTDGMRS